MAIRREEQARSALSRPCRYVWNTSLLLWCGFAVSNWTALIRALEGLRQPEKLVGERKNNTKQQSTFLKQQLKHIKPAKSKNLTLTPWMRPFMRNVCWGNVWCNTCRINTDSGWNQLIHKEPPRLKAEKKQQRSTMAPKLQIHFRIKVLN